MRATGRIAMFAADGAGRRRGYGFIDVDGRQEIGRAFFAASECGEDFAGLAVGDNVIFDLLLDAPRGVRAVGVRRA